MPRVASLYLPLFSTDWIMRAESTERQPDPSFFRVRERADLPEWEDEGEKGDRILCSCPREGGWRPGARWARVSDLPSGTPPRIGGSAGTPLVTSEQTGQRIVIAGASPAALALGLHPGMPLATARVLIPGLDVRERDVAGEAAALHQLAVFAAKRWTPFAAVCDTDGLWLDLGGVAHLFGGEERMCRRILAFCARLGLAARIAVAETWGAAHALARHGGEPLVLCPQGCEEAAITPLPVAALRLDERQRETARRMGIEVLGDFLPMPRGPVVRRFGRGLAQRLDQALGRAVEPIAPVIPPDVPRAELRFAEPIMTAEAIAPAIAELVSRLVAILGRRGLGARMLRLACRRVDGSDHYTAIVTTCPTRDAAHLVRLLNMKIETIDPGFGIEAMTLAAMRADRLGAVAIDGELAGERPVPDLSQLVDRLIGRLGRRALWRPGAIESDVPERSVRRLPPLSPAAGWPRDWPRPARLLSPPERIADVLALLPDSPPRRFTWRGRQHHVTRGDGPERIHGEWWRRSSEEDAVRDYFRVEDEAGQRFWLYRRGDGVDASTGDLGWFVQGVFG